MNFESKIEQFNLKELAQIPFAKEKQSVQQSKQDLVLAVSDICNRLQEQSIQEHLLALGKETAIIRLFFDGSKVGVTLPKIYIDEQMLVGLYDANFNPLSLDISFVSYQTELIRQANETRIVVGEQVLQINSFKLVVPLGLNDQYISNIIQLDKKGTLNEFDLLRGTGMITNEVLKYYPKPVRPTASFNQKEVYSIIEDLGPDPRYQNQSRFKMVQINPTTNQPIGEPFDVIPNFSLKDHWDKYKNRLCYVSEKEEKPRGCKVKFILASLASCV